MRSATPYIARGFRLGFWKVCNPLMEKVRLVWVSVIVRKWRLSVDKRFLMEGKLQLTPQALTVPKISSALEGRV